MAAERWLLQGGTVLDGAGGAAPRDVLLEGDRIAAVLPQGAMGPEVPGDHLLDCSGLFVAPGFVDAHTHDDSAAADPERYAAKVLQGVTTSVVAQDGFGWAPVPAAWRDALVRYWRPVNGLPVRPDGADLLAEGLPGYFAALAGQLGINVAVLAGHVNLRLPHAGFALRRLAANELAAMAAALERALEQGACGLSTGLTYIPARASDTNELLALAPALARHGLPYVSHLRGYGPDIFGAVDEAFDLARRTGCRVHLSHLHLSARAVWGQTERLVGQLDRAIADGLAVTWDLYPYQAGSSVLYQYLPPGFQDGGPVPFLARLTEPATAAALAADPGFATTDWSRCIISHTASGRHVGQPVSALAAGPGLPLAEAVTALLVAEDLDVGVIVHQTLEADDDEFLLHPACAVGSDGIFASGRPHPRAHGAFARFWRRYVHDLGRLSPAEAARRMAGLAAAVHGLDDRGRLAPGLAADVAVFDGATFADRATYEAPHLTATGMRHVFINGQPVLRDGTLDGRRAGRVLAPAK